MNTYFTEFTILGIVGEVFYFKQKKRIKGIILNNRVPFNICWKSTMF